MLAVETKISTRKFSEIKVIIDFLADVAEKHKNNIDLIVVSN